MSDTSILNNIEITDETAGYIGDVCETIAKGLDLGDSVAGMIGVGAELTARLSNAGYKPPSAKALRDKAMEIGALPDLT